MHTISARNINPLNNYSHDKNDSTEESNQISLHYYFTNIINK